MLDILFSRYIIKPKFQHSAFNNMFLIVHTYVMLLKCTLNSFACHSLFRGFKVLCLQFLYQEQNLPPKLHTHNSNNYLKNA